jgi:hypothetical protein
MIKIISGIALLFLIVFFGLPYVQIYQLDNALKNNNVVELNKMIDLQAIREVQKESIQSNVKNMIGSEKTKKTDAFSNLMEQGAKMLSEAAVDSVVDIAWVKEEILKKTKGTTIFSSMSFAFFESPTRFMIRIGEMREKPLYIQMTLTDWTWRVTALYS